MVEADFTPDGVTIRLSREESEAVFGALNWLTAGRSPAEFEFELVIGASREAVERLEDDLRESEFSAREAGNHWRPLDGQRAQKSGEFRRLLDAQDNALQERTKPTEPLPRPDEA